MSWVALSSDDARTENAIEVSDERDSRLRGEGGRIPQNHGMPDHVAKLFAIEDAGGSDWPWRGVERDLHQNVIDRIPRKYREIEGFASKKQQNMHYPCMDIDTTGSGQADDMPMLRRPAPTPDEVKAASETLAAHSGLDGEELNLLIEFGRASKKAAQHAAVADPGEAHDKARLWGFRLEFYQRSKSVVLPADGLKDDPQYRSAARFVWTYREMRRLETQLGSEITEKPSIVKVAQNQTATYIRKRNKNEPTAA